MRHEKCYHVTCLALAEPIDNRQVEALLVCRLSPRIMCLGDFYLFRSRYLDMEKGNNTRARHLTCTNTSCARRRKRTTLPVSHVASRTAGRTEWGNTV